jgi:hypothetical protein
LLTGFLLTFYSATLSAIEDSYLPLTEQEIGKPFPLHKDKTIDTSDPVSFIVSAGPSGVHFESHVGTEPNLIAYGKDKNGNNWRVVISVISGIMPVDFYTADIDKNSNIDVVIMMPTGGNGLAPTVHIFVLMFDVQGRPIPFEADGYFESFEDGIDSLVDMNGDGRTELIYMNFSDGYWITNIYVCQNSRWSRVQGAFGKRKYPLFTRFTNQPNDKPVIPMPNRHPFAPNLSNDEPLQTGFLTSFNIPEGSSGPDVKLTIEDSNGKPLQCTPDYWHDSARVILDSPTGRQIAHLAGDDKENASTILKPIIEKRIKIFLYGQRYADKCSPEIVWATER